MMVASRLQKVLWSEKGTKGTTSVVLVGPRPKKGRS